MAQEKREGFEGEDTRSVNNRLPHVHDIRVDTIHIFFSLFLVPWDIFMNYRLIVNAQRP